VAYYQKNAKNKSVNMKWNNADAQIWLCTGLKILSFVIIQIGDQEKSSNFIVFCGRKNNHMKKEE
jgi:hypothetical protein